MAKKSHKPDDQDIKNNGTHDEKAAEGQVKEEATEETTGSSEKEPEKKEATAEERLAELQDKYLRLSAEFDNYRKRTIREKGELLKSANEDLLARILPVADDFERALTSIDKATDMEAVKTGVHLIFRITSYNVCYTKLLRK